MTWSKLQRKVSGRRAVVGLEKMAGGWEERMEEPLTPSPRAKSLTQAGEEALGQGDGHLGNRNDISRAAWCRRKNRSVMGHLGALVG